MEATDNPLGTSQGAAVATGKVVFCASPLPITLDFFECNEVVDCDL